jgi:hypothetical protein
MRITAFLLLLAACDPSTVPTPEPDAGVVQQTEPGPPADCGRTGQPCCCVVTSDGGTCEWCASGGVCVDRVCR